MGSAFAASWLVAMEAALAFALAGAFLREHGTRGLRVLLSAGLVAGLLLGVGVAVASGMKPAELALPLERLRRLVVLSLIVAGFALRRVSSTSIGQSRARLAAGISLVVMGTLWPAPEGAALAGVLDDLGTLKGSPTTVWLVAGAGAGVAGALAVLLESLAARAKLGLTLTPSSLLFLLIAVKLVGVAAVAVAAPPPALAVVDVIERNVHDGFHLLFVLLQLPDHPYLRDGVYQAILLALDRRAHALLAALIVALPLVAAWRCFARRPRPELPASTRAPERRLVVSAFRRASFRVSGSFLGALLLTWAAIWSARSRSEALYDPVPAPVVDDGAGTVLVPLGDPFGAAADGRMRKYAYSSAGHTIVFLTVRRSDGTLVAALDRCEICQPKGYAQLGRGYVFCKYCKTPIPIATVGQPGGCNPIPLPGATVAGSMLRIPRSHLLEVDRKGMADER